LKGASEEILEAFAAESAEILEAIEASIKALEEGRDGAIDELFRAVHTLKGSAAIVGLEGLESFAHAFETRLSALRSGAARLGADSSGALLSCRDTIASILGSGGLEGEGTALRDLDRALGLEGGPEAEEAAPPERAAGAEAAGEAGPRAAAGHSLGGYSRVANHKLDALLEEASELSQAISEFGGRLRSSGRADLVDEALGLYSLAARHYRTMLETRTVPFGAVAEAYRRGVADIALESGKEIEFSVLGAETEIDKALADRLSEPLLHLARNSADHGIEAPAVREAAGKPRAGKLVFSARRESGFLVVRVEDDGRGIDLSLVRERAEEEGIAPPPGGASEEWLLSLLTRPGFSLSRKVTKWSGRGVGLDAVERGARRARGSLRLASSEGSFFAAEIRLPLALSLVEGFTAVAGETSLLVPFESVSSCEAFEDRDHEALDSPYRTIPILGALLPALDLSILYGGKAAERRVAIVVRADSAGAANAAGAGAVALLVDEVGEALSAAVRPLDRRFADSPGLAGIAALGEGSLVLALDAHELIRLAQSRDRA
jgi:two-component system chemotaxis sensor kinase CheA